jgi:transposase
MDQSLRACRFVPKGFLLERWAQSADQLSLWVRSDGRDARCPACGSVSRRVRSRYCRRPADLPLSGFRVQLHVTVRRFLCEAVLCRQQVFAERFADDVLAPMARRTGRLEHIVHHLGLALGGRPAASFARRLMLPVSNDTLLRVVRRRAQAPEGRLAVIGIDDFAWRRNHRYGTIVCDLERRRPVTLLPDRQPATAEAWLARHQSIVTVARDRGGGYGEAAARALPHATQVADRWHLMENASRAFLDAVRKSMRPIRRLLGAASIKPALLTKAEHIQYEGYLRRREIDAAIMALIKEGVPLKQIARRTGHSRQVVRQVARGERTDIFRTRESSLEAHLPWLDAQWDAGSRNATELWRRIRQRGFRGSLRVIGEWATRRRRAEQANDQNLRRVPSARTIAQLMTSRRDRLSKAETITVAAIEDGVPHLVEARTLIAEFHAMLRDKDISKLAAWLPRACASLLASFARGVLNDQAAVSAAISSSWSNGQTEGQITKLKLVKRQMYGRGKIDLLQARLIGAT